MADITAKVPQYRAKLMGLQSTAIHLAYGLGPAIGGWLCTLHGARASFFIVGGAAAVSSGFVTTQHNTTDANATATVKQTTQRATVPFCNQPRIRNSFWPSWSSATLGVHHFAVNVKQARLYSEHAQALSSKLTLL